MSLAATSVTPDDATTAPGRGRVVWTELIPNDPASAAQFYRSVVGYDARSVERAIGEYIMLSHQERDRAGILRNPSEQTAPVWLTYFGVDDPVTAARRVEALGGRAFILWPSPELRHGTMAVVTDPTGELPAGADASKHLTQEFRKCARVARVVCSDGARNRVVIVYELR